MSKLTPRQARFCDEYLIDLNATQAAIRAGYSPRTANQQGARLLANVKIQAALGERMEKRAERTGIDADSVVRRLAEIAFGDLGEFLDILPDGTARVDLAKAKGKTRLLKKYDCKQILAGDPNDALPIGDMKIELHDGLRALDMLMRHLGAYAPDKVAQTDSAGNDVEQSDQAILSLLIGRLQRRKAARDNDGD
jgi:phage terminase small subunit